MDTANKDTLPADPPIPQPSADLAEENVENPQTNDTTQETQQPIEDVTIKDPTSEASHKDDDPLQQISENDDDKMQEEATQEEMEFMDLQEEPQNEVDDTGGVDVLAMSTFLEDEKDDPELQDEGSNHSMPKDIQQVDIPVEVSKDILECEEEMKESEEQQMDVDEQLDEEKVKATAFASVLLDENSRSDSESNPIEEVDPTKAEESNDGQGDLDADEDPLMKDAGTGNGDGDVEGGDDSGDEEAGALEEEDKAEPMLSVKPPGALMEEGNFVDIPDDESMPGDDRSMEADPIETAEQADLDGDIFNGKEAETILAEDDSEPRVEDVDSEAVVQDLEEATGEGDKYVITLANRTEKSKCSICDKEEVPEYLANKNNESECICTATCLTKFKEQHADNFVERILRLRVFATEDARIHEPVVRKSALEEDELERGRDPFRKCVKCQRCFDVDNYLTWEAQDYCDEACLAESQSSINTECAKCQGTVPSHLLGKYCVRFGTTVTQFCKTACLISYKKARKLCQFCQEDLNDDETMVYCSKRCKYAAQPTVTEPKESALCSVCRQVKEVELNVRGDSQMDSLCSERCLVAYKFVNQVELVKCVVCPTTFSRKPGDPSIYEVGALHSLCSKECQKIFLITHREIVNCSICVVKKYDFDMIRSIENGTVTCICSLSCLRVYFECSYSQMAMRTEPNVTHLEMIANGQHYTYEGMDILKLIDSSYNAGKPAVQAIYVPRPRAIPKQRNKAVMCSPRMLTKAIQHKVKERTVGMQTNDTTTRWIPIPVPIFVPTPLHMYVEPIPMLTPIPIPIVIPIFVLTGRKSTKGILKEITKIKNRIPADPLEAEILMMADMAAGDKRNAPTSDSDDDVANPAETSKILDPSLAQMDNASASFSDEVLSMAFKMANEYTEPLDLESEVDNSSRLLAGGRRGRMNTMRGGRSQQQQQRMLEMVKPDENLALKYTFGVNAWKQWATTKNLELQKLKSSKFVKLDLLQLSAEDFCFCLCQFIKEVRKPNGTPYASDTIYYLCLGIQLYLYENGRIDNLFCDPYYEKFTDTFNEICLSFCQLYNDSQYIVTRVEEEHLWESKQLGAHSPLVLLNTLLFFNTKHFNLTTVDDHTQLSFSHIMKHWKRNANAPNQRNVLLRFYPPSKAAWGKRKVYEQQECLDNPLRCPVRLYEFFLSKCPESVKTRNDVFYLQPERSCVPDSPVWYSTSALERVQLEKMLNRMKMIKEISMAILGT